MSSRVRRVAVLGSGVMGSAIAAHFANAGVPSLVLDIVPRDLSDAEKAAGLSSESRKFRDRLARESVAALAKARPSSLFVPGRISLIEIGNLEDDLPRLREADWVIEVVKEDMKIKKQVLAAAAEHLADEAILSSNTSGLSLTEMAQALPEGVRRRFLGTHFFNPPRYMKLLELVPTPHVAPEVIDRVAEFATIRLGKGVVRAKDTPNFIANRIGTHAMLNAVRVMGELGLSVEEMDALTGPPLGRPKTATFRLCDLIGLDTLLLVARYLHMATADEGRDAFEPPPFLVRMVEKGLLGRKSGAGFYKKVKQPGPAILVLDLETLDYREQRKPELPELGALKGLDDPARRIRTLVGSEGRGAEAAWKILAPTFSYAAMRLGEIADDARTIDRAIKLGFNWELGPFEIWNALGFRQTVERMRMEGHPLPEWVHTLYDQGADALYKEDDEGTVYGPTPAGPTPIAPDARHITFATLRSRGRVVRENPSASLVDLGEDVLGLEFHSKMNAIDADTMEMIVAAADQAERNWRALVVANDGVNFSAGANLMMIAEAAQKGDWKAIEASVVAFQHGLNRLERCGVPVVVAPHGMALGGGAETVLAGNAVHAAAESYIGLVEVGAGLLPAGGGCLRLYKRNVAALTDGKDVYPALRSTFETIGMAKVSTSAEEARSLGFLRPGDGWSMNPDYLVADAKDLALALARAGRSAELDAAVPVLGRDGVALVEAALLNMHEGRFISEHDRKIGREIGRILSGGDLAGPTTVSEQHILDLEREGFLRLCGEPKTHERIAALLKTGKPLRN